MKNATLDKKKGRGRVSVPAQYLTKNGGWLLCIAMLLFGLNGLLTNSVIGVLGFVCLTIGFFFRVGTWEVFGKRYEERLLYGGLSFASIYVLVLVLGYVMFGMSSLLAIFVSILFVVGVMRVPTGTAVYPKLRREVGEGAVLLGLSATASLAVIAIITLARTQEPVISPWSHVSIFVFVLFFLALLTYILGARERQDVVTLFVAILFLLMATSVSVIMYGVGFGFDPFIHRAAETAMVESGRIEPLQPLYLGQYVLVAALHHVSALSVKFVDIVLVPMFASALLPLAAVVGLRRGWGLSRSQAYTWWPVILLVPFMLLTFTVPFTFTYTLFLSLILLLPALKTTWEQSSLVLATFTGMLFHPLLALPMFCLALGSALYARLKIRSHRALILSTLALATGVGIPALFIVYQLKTGQVVEFQNLFANTSTFLNLFRNPFFDPFPYIPIYLDVLYDLRYFIPMLVPMIAVSSIVLFWQNVKTIAPVFLAFAAGLMLCIFAMCTLFTFKDIISHEQGEFALRLLQVWYVLPLPFVVLAVARAAKSEASALALAVTTALLVTISWYFSYPQYNLQYPFIAPSVSHADLEAVHMIDEHANSEPYIVLSNQMTSAAALQEFGFVHYYPLQDEKVLWYAIPTGGRLYVYYSRIVFEGARREIIDDLFLETEVSRIYFVMHDYVPWTDSFRSEMGASSDGVLRTTGDRILIHYFDAPYGDED